MSASEDVTIRFVAGTVSPIGTARHQVVLARVGIGDRLSDVPALREAIGPFERRLAPHERGAQCG